MVTKLTEEEKAALPRDLQILHEINQAYERGDDAAADELRKQLDIPAEALMAAKKSRGADWVRKQGLRTQRAEEKYGKDWLDR